MPTNYGTPLFDRFFSTLPGRATLKGTNALAELNLRRNDARNTVRALVADIDRHGAKRRRAINERIDHAWRAQRGRSLSHRARLVIALVLLVGCMFLASRFGLVALIANGYRVLAYLLLAVYILPLMTIGVWRLWNHRSTPVEVA